MPARGTASKTLGRKTDQRAALVRSLARSLILDGSISTTQAKAKALRSFVEKLATKAKSDTLHSRRQIIQALNDVEATDALVERMVGSNRNGGYLRITREELRRGDGAQLTTIEFVDTPQAPAKSEKKAAPAKKETTKAKADDKKDAA